MLPDEPHVPAVVQVHEHAHGRRHLEHHHGLRHRRPRPRERPLAGAVCACVWWPCPPVSSTECPVHSLTHVHTPCPTQHTHAVNAAVHAHLRDMLLLRLQRGMSHLPPIRPHHPHRRHKLTHLSPVFNFARQVERFCRTSYTQTRETVKARVCATRRNVSEAVAPPLKTAQQAVDTLLQVTALSRPLSRPLLRPLSRPLFSCR